MAIKGARGEKERIAPHLIVRNAVRRLHGKASGDCGNPRWDHDVCLAVCGARVSSFGGAGRRRDCQAGFVVVLGVLASLTTNLEYWNWYDFPGNYVAGYMVTQIIGFTLVGLVVAALVKSEAAPRS